MNAELIEINPSRPATLSIIWLHGLGASSDDFVPVAHQLHHLTGLALRFVFPQAPSRPVTINNGAIMPAWYDIRSFERDGELDTKGIELSVQQINLLIKQEIMLGLNADKIILAGFSQGAVVALSTLLAHPERLGGAIALSGYLPYTKIPSNHATPIFIGHGTADDIVPYTLGQAAYHALTHANYPVTLRSYTMPHSVCDQEIRDIAGWLNGLG